MDLVESGKNSEALDEIEIYATEGTKLKWKVVEDRRKK